MTDHPLKLITGTANIPFAERVAAHLNTALSPALIDIFSDGESRIEINEDVRGSDVFVIQPTCFPSNHNIMELYFMLDALKRSSCWRVTAVIPYFGYGRQDRKNKPRVPISAKSVANIISIGGVNRILTIDLHAGQIQGFFECPVDHLYGSSVFINHIREYLKNDTVLLSPDAGGTERVSHYAKYLKLPMATSTKKRTNPNEIDKMMILGTVNKMHVIVIDDMIDTAGTTCKVASLAMNDGALSVTVYTTHPVFSGSAPEKINNSPISKIYVTDTIPLNPYLDTSNIECISNKVEVISVAPLFAQAINNIHNEDSVSSLFEGYIR